MNNIVPRYLFLVLLSLFPVISAAEETNESRPVTGIYSLETGGVRTTATYLSPLHYHGLLMGASGRWEKAMPFNSQKAIMDFEGGIFYSDMLNPSGTASMMNFNAEFRFGISWRRRLPHSLQVTAGGYYGIEGGALWLFRNSNNPVEARLRTGAGATGSLSWIRYLGKIPILLTERVSLPVAGIFFSPAYGESYYEIFLGNHKNLAHFGWPGNYFGIDNKLSVILDFGRTAMEIGYRFSFRNQESNHLVTREWTNTFCIGVIPGGLGLKNKLRNSVHALY